MMPRLVGGWAALMRDVSLPPTSRVCDPQTNVGRELQLGSARSESRHCTDTGRVGSVWVRVGGRETEGIAVETR